MMTAKSLEQTGFILIDLQNDFLHPAGAYARGGVTAPSISVLPARLQALTAAARSAGIYLFSTHFTLIPARGGQPLLSAHLHRLRPFLGPGDFAPGSFGHELVAELQPVDFKIEKIAYSAFYMTRLEWLLRRLEIRTLIFAGIVTNGGVASTVRDAHVRDFHPIVLSDGCAAFDPQTHKTALQALTGLAEITTTTDLLARLEHGI